MNKNTWTIVIVLAIILGGSYYISKDTKTTESVANKDTYSKKLPDVLSTKAGSYEVYSSEKILKASSTHNVVLFFRAGWCPTCRVVNSDINMNLSQIPENLTILDIDYDNSIDLKKKYGVTYQHTFVQVDKDGLLINKWTGSPTLSSILSEIK